MKNWTLAIIAIINFSFSGLSTSPCPFMTADFDCATGTYLFNSQARQLESLTWDFGDGTVVSAIIDGTGEDFSMEHQYQTSGNYTIIATWVVAGTTYTDTCPSTFYYGVDHFGALSFSYTSLGNGEYQFTFTGDDFTTGSGYNHSMALDFGDGNTYSESGVSWNSGHIITTHTYYGISGSLTVTLTRTVIYNTDAVETCSYTVEIPIDFVSDPCCSNFAPISGERYWVSAWVLEEHAQQVKSYLDARVQIEFIGVSSPSLEFIPTGEIIDGWQRIVGDFVVPTGSTDLKVHLVNNNNSIDCYFDDVRIHPFNASMKSYVYDPETLWLTAELDDNNYATFYEYDNEGQLIRIKKETARGIMTIQESRSSNPKK